MEEREDTLAGTTVGDREDTLGGIAEAMADSSVLERDVDAVSILLLLLDGGEQVVEMLSDSFMEELLFP